MRSLYLFLKFSFVVVYISCLTKLKYETKKSCILIAVINIILLIANFVIYFSKGILFLVKIFPLTVTIPVGICFVLLSKTSGAKTIFSYLTVCNYSMTTSFVGFLSSMIFDSLVLRILLESLCSVLIIVFIVKVFRKPYFKMLATLDKGWGVLCSVPFLLNTILYLLLYYPIPISHRPEVIPIVFFLIALVFVFYAAIYLNFENISQYYEFRNNKELILMQTDMQRKEYNALMDKTNAVRIYRHDMRHHINAVNTFLNDNNISEAQNYLSKMDANLNKTVIESYCDNYIVNVILSSYISKAKNEKIDVTSMVDISENIKIDNMELGLIFANALENAINTCKKFEDLKDRKISIVCKEHYDQLYIQICNPFMGKVQFDGEFPVSTNQGHGIGTRSIAGIAEKYGGVFSFTAQDGIFKTTVILNAR